MSDKAAIEAFASTISSQALGLAFYRPEEWARPTSCFANVMTQVDKSGGRLQPGWFFHCRAVERLSGARYLVAVHHAVWHSPTGHLVDVTPFHADPKHHPYAPGGSVLFLIDDKSPPVTQGNLRGPLPLRFSALDPGEQLAAHVERLAADEVSRCALLYEQAGPSTP